MLANPMDILEQFPVRKTKKQKRAFRDAVRSYVTDLGYYCVIEKGSLGSKNIVIGNPERADYLVTAHYDTCARLPIPNLLTPRSFFGFLGYQLLLTVVIFLFPAVAGVLLKLVFDDSFIAFYGAYIVMWISLILMMAGPANKHNANDNTSGVVTVLEIARSLPEAQRKKVCFVLFDLEELGLIGSASYRSAHKTATNRQTVLNLDCVGEGDDIMMFPTGKLRRNERKMNLLDRICGVFGEKSLSLHRKGFAVYPSDQTNFPYGVGIASFNKTKRGMLYLGRIHTGRDTILEQTNVNILRAAISTLISGDAVQ